MFEINIIRENNVTEWACVVYFDQGLGAAHPKRWLKSLFQYFLC